jgi:hypothetical protein
MYTFMSISRKKSGERYGIFSDREDEEEERADHLALSGPSVEI